MSWLIGIIIGICILMAAAIVIVVVGNATGAIKPPWNPDAIPVAIRLYSPPGGMNVRTQVEINGKLISGGGVSSGEDKLSSGMGFVILSGLNPVVSQYYGLQEGVWEFEVKVSDRVEVFSSGYGSTRLARVFPYQVNTGNLKIESSQKYGEPIKMGRDERHIDFSLIFIENEDPQYEYSLSFLGLATP